MDLILDVNTQLYPMILNDKFRLMLYGTLREDGLPDEGEYDRVSLFENYGGLSLMIVFRSRAARWPYLSMSCTGRSTDSRVTMAAQEMPGEQVVWRRTLRSGDY